MGTDPRSRRREEGRTRLIEAARERYLAGERIEISTLASDHGISRASAYRWLGDNDRLLGEVLVWRSQQNFEEQRRKHARKRGRSKVVAIIADFMRHAAESEHFNTQLRADPPRVLRILTSGAFETQGVVVALFEGLLQEEADAGRLELPVEAHTLAYALVRLMEAFLYGDIVAGEEFDHDRAVAVMALLLPD